MKVSPGCLVPFWLPQDFAWTAGMVGTCFDHGQRLEVSSKFLPPQITRSSSGKYLSLSPSPFLLPWRESQALPETFTPKPRLNLCTSGAGGMMWITRSGCGRSDTRGQGWHTVGAFPGRGGTSLGLDWGAGGQDWARLGQQRWGWGGGGPWSCCPTLLPACSRGRQEWVHTMQQGLRALRLLSGMRGDDKAWGTSPAAHAGLCHHPRTVWNQAR